ncbi:hypothetical protein ACJMK2_007758 [Sinanodonta woodiana]|uniref:PHD-type domain-containing protein n=1 Tax=Sinanodonta woodiana TaxID=1069815 RepID=A0ABD3VJX6_SINWO
MSDDSRSDEEMEESLDLEEAGEAEDGVGESLFPQSRGESGEDSCLLAREQDDEERIPEKKGKKRKKKDGSEKEKKKSKKKKKKHHNDHGDSDVGSDAEIDSPKKKKKKKEKEKKLSLEITPQPRIDRPRPGPETSDDLCEKLGLNNIEDGYTDDDFETLNNYKLFREYIQPRLAKANPKVAASKMVTLIAAKWREFATTAGAWKKNKLGLTSPTIEKKEEIKEKEEEVEQEQDTEPETIPSKDDSVQEDNEEDESVEGKPKRKRGQKKQAVAPIKIKLSKKKRRRRPNSMEVSTQVMRSLRGNWRKPVLLQKKRQRRRHPIKRSKRGRGVRNKKKTKLTNKYPTDPDTDHQDYCEVCQQGGEIILCDTCPRAYHLVCLDPELEEAPEGKWSCPHCEGEGIQEQEEDEHMEFCRVCKDGGELICCDSCPSAYHPQCCNPPLKGVPDGEWHCPRCSCPPLKGKVAKILTWRWTEPPKNEEKLEELDHTHHHSPKETAMYRIYMRKNDMDEPPPLEDGSSYGP